MPFVATMGLFITTYLGLVVSRWPYMVPPNYTLWDAASAYESQLFLLLGLLFVIPIVLVYTARLMSKAGWPGLPGPASTG